MSDKTARWVVYSTDGAKLFGPVLRLRTAVRWAGAHAQMNPDRVVNERNGAVGWKRGQSTVNDTINAMERQEKSMMQQLKAVLR